MDNQLKTTKLLENLGLEEKEAEIYLSLLDNGAMLPQHIARATGLKRTTLYNLFPDLIEKGVIKEITQGKRRLLTANSPDDLFQNYEQKYREIKQNIADLSAVYRMQGMKPKIQIFEGLDGVKQCYADTLTAKQGVSYYQQFTNYHEKIQEWILKDYVPSRIRKGIPVRAIVPIEAKEFHPASREAFREAKYVPLKQFHFKIGTLIYNDKINFISCEKGNPLVGIIIQSKPIADTQKALFDLAWEGAKAFELKG